MQRIRLRVAGVPRAEVEPRVLVDLHAVRAVGTDNGQEVVAFGACVKGLLVVAGLQVPGVREHPDLQQAHRLGGVGVFLRVQNTCSSGHDLDFTVANHRRIPHAVLMFQIPFKRNGDDLHVVVRMGIEPGTRPQ